MQPNRRNFLKGTTVIGIGGLAGCMGGGDDGGSDGGSDGGATSNGGTPAPPWTTEQLADLAIENGETELVHYIAGGDREVGQNYLDFMSENFAGGEITAEANLVGDERIVQELQSGNVQADSMAGGDDAANEVGFDGIMTLPDKLAIREEMDSPEFHISEYLVQFRGSGVRYSMLYNSDDITSEQEQLLQERQWNALLTDAFADAQVVEDFAPVFEYYGIVMDHYASDGGEVLPGNVDMEPRPWLEAIRDNVQMEFTDGVSAAARFVGQGSALVQLMSYSHHWPRYGPDGEGMPLEITLPNPEYAYVKHAAGGIVPKEGPSDYGGLWIYSALMEEETQQYIANQTPNIPGRIDLEYPDIGGYKAEVMDVAGAYTQDEIFEYADMAEPIFNDVMGSPAPTV